MTNDNLLWANRTGTRQYLGENSRGASVKIGMGEGEFTPGELLKLALATCQALSADHTLASKLGTEFDATVTVTSEKHDSEERYTRIDSQIITDFSSLDEEQMSKLLERIDTAIDRHCTVGHSLKNGLDYTYTFEDE